MYRKITQSNIKEWSNSRVTTDIIPEAKTAIEKKQKQWATSGSCIDNKSKLDCSNLILYIIFKLEKQYIVEKYLINFFKTLIILYNVFEIFII